MQASSPNDIPSNTWTWKILENHFTAMIMTCVHKFSSRPCSTVPPLKDLPRNPKTPNSQWELTWILKWRYSTIFQAIFCGDIPLNKPYAGLLQALYMVGTSWTGHWNRAKLHRSWSPAPPASLRTSCLRLLFCCSWIDHGKLWRK